MKKTPKVGLWIPPRTDLNASITVDNPAHIEGRVCELLLNYLNHLGVDYVTGLDFRHAVIKNHRVYIDDFCLSDLDHFIWFGTIDRHIDSYHLEVLRVLEMSTEVHNSYSFYNVATDKFTAFSILHKFGIPVSDLYLINSENVDVLEPLFDEHSFLLKPRRSSWGRGIVKIDDFSQLRDILEYHPQKCHYLERFYPNDLNEWIGITVLNGTVLYGFRKEYSKISGWKVYDKKQTGGQAVYVKPPTEVEAIAIKIGEILGGSFYGLDFIKTVEGYKVVDINCHPGIYYDFIEELALPFAQMTLKMLPEAQEVFA